MSLKIHIANDLPGGHIIRYTLQLIAANKRLDFSYTDQQSDADLHLDDSPPPSLPLCISFYQKLTAFDFEGLRQLAGGSYFFYSVDGRKDLLASIFYLVNCVQEYAEKKTDKYGRYPHMESLQAKQNILHRNIVQQLIEEFLQSHPTLSKLPNVNRKSSFFLTHDIDTIYGAKNQNGDYALKHRLYHRVPGLLWNHYLGTPDWLNMNRIMAMEEVFGFRSTFYWLVHRDKQNADYDMTNPKIISQIKHIEAKGFENGLHKTIGERSFADDIEQMTYASKERTLGQRYHFLKFNLPNAWHDIEDAGLKLETSLGYSEDFGFRNSYGLPFMPYSLKQKRVYNLIEVPMNVMDGNFFYQGKTLAQAESLLIDWLDRNKQNAVITINFHNNFFDDMLYAGYDKLYEMLLKYFKEEGLNCATQRSLVEEFYKPEFYK